MTKKRRRLPRELLTDEESDCLLEQCDGSPMGMRNRALLLLLEGTGCRISEVLALDPRDIDHDEELANVRCGKGGKQRVVAVAPETLVAVRALLEARAEIGIAADAPIICDRRGRRVRSEYTRALIPRLAKQAGIRKRVHAHGFRHRFTVRLVRHGVPLPSVSHALGHGNIATTNTYCQRIGASHAIDDVLQALDSE